ncbi:hypothetical protein [Sulfuracidifex tepidarius]|uniref:Uncharacterized protein n=1 Tax=Sulfuracidifex tepidarius TaxID=1294262 RepID=A0A510E153_9CREN|nr:hypothetical protein [Sulfuracidifex tepidarius]BBG23471.1 hypothetical protein IC006_0755 [Sulfuracidifex tepidarius]BBG26224.1 hypothetical protein IC007_0729 [Sulfuracidifex tepidarius]
MSVTESSYSHDGNTVWAWSYKGYNYSGVIYSTSQEGEDKATLCAVNGYDSIRIAVTGGSSLTITPGVMMTLFEDVLNNE